MRNPVRTIKRAAPIALFLVTFVYVFVNIAYYAVVSKTDILNSGTIAAYDCQRCPINHWLSCDILLGHYFSETYLDRRLSKYVTLLS